MSLPVKACRPRLLVPPRAGSSLPLPRERTEERPSRDYRPVKHQGFGTRIPSELTIVSGSQLLLDKGAGGFAALATGTVTEGARLPSAGRSALEGAGAGGSLLAARCTIAVGAVICADAGAREVAGGSAS